MVQEYGMHEKKSRTQKKITLFMVQCHVTVSTIFIADIQGISELYKKCIYTCVNVYQRYLNQSIVDLYSFSLIYR